MNQESTTYYKDVQKCVDDIIAEVGKEIVLGLPLGLGKANAVANEFFRRAKADSTLGLKILTALTLERPSWSSDLERRFLEPFIERVFGTYHDLEYVFALRKGEIPENVELCEFFNKPGGYLNSPHAQMNYISTNYTFASRDIVNNGCNVAAQMVTKKTFGDQTKYSLSCNPEVTLDVGELLQKERLKGRKIATIAEVNQNLPFMYGDAVVDGGFFDAILDDPKYYFDLFGAPKMAVTNTDYMIGLYASTLIKDGGTLQIGIGSLGDALVYGLQQRHIRNDIYNNLLVDMGTKEKFGGLIDRVGGFDTFEKGLYGSTEMLVDGYLQLYKSGIVKRKVYNDKALQKLINEEKIDHQVSPKTLEILLKEGVIAPRLNRENIKFLQDFGILKDEIIFENDELVLGENRIPADLSDTKNLDRIIDLCLGSHLKNAILIHAGFFLGPQSFYTELKNMSEEERKLIFMTSVLNVNQLYGNQYGDEDLKILQRRDARFVNAALMLTLSGAVVSDGLEDGQVVSGVGGQYNFVSQAHALPGGRSILMAKSTRAKGSDVSSNIVWKYGHLTIPRHLRDIVITEYGIADVRGKSDKEVIATILNITDSRFQDELLQTAKRFKKIPESYQIPDMFRNNYPERINENLTPYKEKGLFPPFPFGTDFTKEELVIGKALRGLKEKMSEGFGKKASSLGKAMAIRTIPDAAKPYLERLQLDSPATGKERMMQKMVIHALSSQGSI